MVCPAEGCLHHRNQPYEGHGLFALTVLYRLDAACKAPGPYGMARYMSDTPSPQPIEAGRMFQSRHTQTCCPQKR